MNTQTEKFDQSQLKKIPDVRPGDIVKIHQQVKEGDKERIQIFEGVVIARKHGKGISSTITVRKVVDQVGVEKIFPVHSPAIEKIEVVKSSKVRRSKLYYLRTAKGAKAKLKNKDLTIAIAPEPAYIEDSGGAKEKPVMEAPVDNTDSQETVSEKSE